MTSFTGYLYVAPNKVDFEDVFRELKSLPPENMFVLSTVCLIFAMYAVGLVFARKADTRDKMKVRSIFKRSTRYLLFSLFYD